MDQAEGQAEKRRKPRVHANEAICHVGCKTNEEDEEQVGGEGGRAEDQGRDMVLKVIYCGKQMFSHRL